MCFTIRHGKRKSLGSFNVSASVSEAATSRFGLVSVSAQKVSCTSLLYGRPLPANSWTQGAASRNTSA